MRVVLRDARKGDTLFIGGGQPGFAETVSTVVRYGAGGYDIPRNVGGRL